MKTQVLTTASALFLNCLSLGFLYAANGDQAPVSENRSFVGFIGDSISTGAAAHNALRLEPEALSQLFSGQVSFEPDDTYYDTIARQGFNFEKKLGKAPIRLDLAAREFSDSMSWYADNLGLLFSQTYLDAEHYSWSYLVGRQLGYDPEQLWIAARDGEKASSAVAQMERLLHASKGRAPEHLFIFFTGNDLCAPSLELMTSAEDFATHIERSLLLFAKKVEPSDKPIDVWLMNPIGVLQIATSPSILNHKVPFGKDQTISCKELQTLNRRADDSSWANSSQLGDVLFHSLKQIPANFCPSLFSIHAEKSSDINLAISARLTAYRNALKAMRERLKPRLAEDNIVLHHIESTQGIVFDGGDMAGDCLHLNLSGQVKLARLVDDQIKETLKSLNVPPYTK